METYSYSLINSTFLKVVDVKGFHLSFLFYLNDSKTYSCEILIFLIIVNGPGQ